MSDLPSWLANLARLDDDALVLLGNRGLLRRAGKEATELIEADADQVLIGVGDPAVIVRLVPGGPTASRCPCPVAGMCVHLVAAFLWARREVDLESEPVTASALTEVLGWDAERVNRTAGIAAVRRAKDLAPDTIEIVDEGSRLTLSWPGSPRIVVLPGAGFEAMLVSETGSQVAVNAWKVAAVAAVFAAQDRPWPWPAGADSTARLEAAGAVSDTTVRVLQRGLAQVGTGDADLLSASAARAQLAKLNLLARVTGTAAAAAAAVAQRDDDVGEAELLSALAQAWALSKALSQNDPPPQLIATSGGTATQLGRLVPLSAHWWRAPTGARGVTMHLWHADSGEVLRVTNGRAPGADPGFSRSWQGPLLWGSSMASLCAGPFELSQAELRPDGTLSPTSRTSVARRLPFDSAMLPALAEPVNQAEAGMSAVSFGLDRPRLQVIVPRRRRDAASLDLDEVRQQVVWEVIDRDGINHRLETSVFDAGIDTLGWVIAQRLPIVAVVALDRTPRSVFVEANHTLRLIPLTLDTDRPWQLEHKLRTRLHRLRQHRQAAPATATDPISSCLDGVGELLAALAATGLPATPRQHDSLRHRRTQLDGFGLHSLSSALADVDTEPTPTRLLAAQFLLDRARGLLR